MTKTQVLRQLKRLGSEQTRKTYARHGIQGDLYGVRYGDLYKLVKKLGTKQQLAEELWETGNHDARVLATMIADPAQLKATQLDRWAKAIDNQLLLDGVANLTAKTPHARIPLEQWVKSKQEWLASAGWHVLTILANQDKAPLTDSQFAAYLKPIEQQIHQQANRVRYTMNGALIAIGCRSAALERRALATAKRIGKVEVDHGDTACKTPDATAYIKKTAAHRAGKKTKRKAKPAPARA